MHKNILFPIDLEHSAESAAALQVAIDEAQRNKARLTVMTVATGFGTPLVASFFDEQTVKNALKEVARRLKEYVDGNIPDSIEVNPVVVEGNPAERILKQADKEAAGLIVIASHNSQIENLLLGSVAAKVVRHSHCSVTVVK